MEAIEKRTLKNRDSRKVHEAVDERVQKKQQKQEEEFQSKQKIQDEYRKRSKKWWNLAKFEIIEINKFLNGSFETVVRT